MPIPRMLDFSNVDFDIDNPDDEDMLIIPDDTLPGGQLLTMNRKQLRRRERRKVRGATKKASQALDRLYKPIDEWDNEELARGRPRGPDGTFRGPKPNWIPRAIHEQAMERFKEVVRGDIAAHTLLAVKTMEWVLSCEDEDAKGRPLVPATVKLQAATFLVEHLLGKPKQEVSGEISVRLQGILATSMVSADEAPVDFIDVPSWEEDDDEAD